MLAIQEKSEQIRDLISLGKERGFLLFDEVNKLFPTEEHTAEEIESLFSNFERDGIDIYEDDSAARAAHIPVEVDDRTAVEAQHEIRHGDEVEPDRTASLQDNAGDPVRMYLREIDGNGPRTA